MTSKDKLNISVRSFVDRWLTRRWVVFDGSPMRVEGQGFISRSHFEARFKRGTREALACFRLMANDYGFVYDPDGEYWYIPE